MNIKTPDMLQAQDFVTPAINRDEIVQEARAELMDGLNLLAKIHGSNKDLENGQAVQSGDLIALNLNSDCSRFNGVNIPIKLGANLFSKDLEDQLVNLKIGDEFTLTVDHEGNKYEVTGNIIKARRLIPAEINDDLIQKYAADEGVNPEFCTDFSTFEKHQIGQYVQGYLQDLFFQHLFSDLVTKLAQESDISISDEEFQASYAECKASIDNIISDNEGMSELEAYQSLMGPDIKNMEIAKNKLQETAKYLALLNKYAVLLSQHDDHEPTEQDYQELLSAYAESENVAEEELRNQMSFEQFLKSERQQHLAERLFTEYLKHHGE